MRVPLPPPPHETVLSTASSSLSFTPLLSTYQQHANESLSPNVSMTYQHQPATILPTARRLRCSGHTLSTSLVRAKLSNSIIIARLRCRRVPLPTHQTARYSLCQSLICRPVMNTLVMEIGVTAVVLAGGRSIRGVGGGNGGNGGGGGGGGTRSNRGGGKAWQGGNGQIKKDAKQALSGVNRLKVRELRSSKVE